MTRRDAGLAIRGWSERFSLIIVFLSSLIVGILRRPEVLLQPAPIAEDGGVFYVGTYFGSVPEILFRPYAGYQHLVVRLGAFAERLTDPAHAPLVGSLLSLVAISALATFVASRRLERIVPERHHRLLLAGLVLLLPHTRETHGYLLDLPRYVPLYLLGLSLASVPLQRRWRTLELGVVALAGLSGPYAVLLQPIFWYRYVKTRERHWLMISGLLLLTTVVQVISIATDGRRPANLEDPITLSVVMLYRLTAGALLGSQVPSLALSAINPSATGQLAMYALSGLLTAAALVVLSIRTLPRHILVPLAFVTVLMAGSSILGQREGYSVLAQPLAAARYVIVPAALAAVVVVVAAMRQRGRLRTVALVLAGMLAIGVIGDARLLPHPDLGWSAKSQCIGGLDPCTVPVWQVETWSIEWPGIDGSYMQPRPGA